MGRTLFPSPEDFPVDMSLDAHARASALLNTAMKHTGLTQWPFVMSLHQTPNVADVLKGMSHPLTGPVTSDASTTTIAQGDPFPIPYDPAQLDDPVDLVATIARGMSHYMVTSAATPYPGEEEDREYFVDLGAVLLGFGVFLANTAFQFHQTSDGLMAGWGFSRRGALSELDLSYALALAATLADTPDKAIVKALTRNPRSFYKTARKHLRKKRKADVEGIYDTTPLNDGPYR